MIQINPTTLTGPISLDIAMEQGKLLNKVFRIKDTGIDSKIFHTWKMAGLLDTLDNNKWAYMSFIEYLWLCTLESMRKFGCSHKLMKKVHYNLFTKAYDDELGKKTLKEIIKYLTNLSSQRPLINNEIQYLEESKWVLNDEILLQNLKKDITYFYQLVLKCFNYNNEVGLIIYEDQRFTSYVLSNNVTSNDVPLDLSVPHIKIPLTSFIKKFIDDEQKSKFLQPTGLISEQEMQVLIAIKNQNIKNITIHFDATQKIETKESGIINGEDAKKIMHILGMKNYNSIELHTRDGESLSFTHSKKNYLKK